MTKKKKKIKKKKAVYKSLARTLGAEPEYGPAIVKKLVALVTTGQYLPDAARMLGIRAATFRRWIKSKPDLAHALYRAEGMATGRDLGAIDRAAQGWIEKKTHQETGPGGEVVRAVQQTCTKFDWRAAAWRLERRNPAGYAGYAAREVPAAGAEDIRIVRRAPRAVRVDK